MNFLGIDVHTQSTTFCLLDSDGEILERGKVDTTAPALQAVCGRFSELGELRVAQESGKMTYFVYDIFSGMGIEILTFNAYHLRMIAASRKKTDERDAYWLARALQTGMTPHPVYVPTGEVRLLRQMLAQRSALVYERRRWLLRARSYLQASGYLPKRGHRKIDRLVASATDNPLGLDSYLSESLELCSRMECALTPELESVEARLKDRAKSIDAVLRLKTIPAVGDWVSLLIYAWVGDVSRFPTARHLSSYAGLVPSVRQSGQSTSLGSITRQGSSQLRTALVQSGHVLLFRCKAEHTLPLKNIAKRIENKRMRRKIAVVAAARHILRIAYYVLRDGCDYDPRRLTSAYQTHRAA